MTYVGARDYTLVAIDLTNAQLNSSGIPTVAWSTFPKRAHVEFEDFGLRPKVEWKRFTFRIPP